MKKALIAAILLMSTSAFAEVPNEYVLKVSPDEVNLISDGLQTQPFGKVSPLMNKLRQQVIEQQSKAEPSKPVIPDPKKD